MAFIATLASLFTATAAVTFALWMVIQVVKK